MTQPGNLPRIRPHTAAPILFALALALFAGPANAAGDLSPRRLTVTGAGEATRTPDQAQLSAGVVSEAHTAATALAENSAKMKAVFATLMKMGIPEKAIQTSGFSVSPQYPPYDSKQPRLITGYQVSNIVTVKVDDLHKLGPSLDALVASGANQVNGIGFAIRDPKPLLAKAGDAAVKDAVAKAQTFAKAAGVTLGPIMAIQESGAEPPRPMMLKADTAMRAGTPVAPGEQPVSASVTISWEIH